MSRQMVMVIACDACGNTADDGHEVTGHVLTIDRLTRRIDLCGSCEEGLLSPVHSLLADYGVEPEPEDLGERCPLCEVPNTHASRKALAQHLRGVHDSGIREMIAQGLMKPARRG